MLCLYGQSVSCLSDLVLARVLIEVGLPCACRLFS